MMNTMVNNNNAIKEDIEFFDKVINMKDNFIGGAMFDATDGDHRRTTILDVNIEIFRNETYLNIIGHAFSRFIHAGDFDVSKFERGWIFFKCGVYRDLVWGIHPKNKMKTSLFKDEEKEPEKKIEKLKEEIITHKRWLEREGEDEGQYNDLREMFEY